MSKSRSPSWVPGKGQHWAWDCGTAGRQVGSQDCPRSHSPPGRPPFTSRITSCLRGPTEPFPVTPFSHHQPKRRSPAPGADLAPDPSAACTPSCWSLSALLSPSQDRPGMPRQLHRLLLLCLQRWGPVCTWSLHPGASCIFPPKKKVSLGGKTSNLTHTCSKSIRSGGEQHGTPGHIFTSPEGTFCDDE